MTESTATAAESVKSMPEAMRSLTPHLVCRDSAAAIEFYKQAFDAEELMRMPDPQGKMMHACLQIGDSLLFLVDEYPEMGGICPLRLNGSPVSIHLMVPDVDATVERAVAAGAKVTLPVADMFWGDRYGVIVDPAGHQWSIATHIRDMTHEEMAAAMKEAVSQPADAPAN